MADLYTQIANAIVPEVYANYSFEEHVEKLDIFQAGILYSDPEVAGKFGGGGSTVNYPGWKDLGSDPSEPVNDDPANSIETKRLTSRREVMARQIRAQAWGVADLTKILAGDDPQKVIVQRQTDYWRRATKQSIVATIKGVIADNIANDGGDLVLDTNASIVEEDVIDAAYLLGDAADGFTAIMMHSKQMKALKKLNLIDFVPPSEQGGPVLEYYMGLRCFVDDGLIVNGSEYTAVMFRPQALLWEEMPVELEGGPLEVDRQPKKGHGAGVTELVARRHFILHPRGWRWLGASVADEFPTDTELATAANWDRAITSIKNARMVFVTTTEA